MTAAKDPGIAAVVSQVPYVDGLTMVYMLSPKNIVKTLAAGFKDVMRMVTGGEPHYIPVIGDPDTFALMNTPDSLPGFMAIIPDDSDWENRCPARIGLEAFFYRPVARARSVKCPALVILAEKDTLIYPKAVEKTASRMREVTLVHMDVGHFDVYVGDLFEKTVEMEADFLARHLLA
jgi:pimeloyl-ACP methyl ester carboxylesterase